MNPSVYYKILYYLYGNNLILNKFSMLVFSNPTTYTAEQKPYSIRQNDENVCKLVGINCN